MRNPDLLWIYNFLNMESKKMKNLEKKFSQSSKNNKTKKRGGKKKYKKTRKNKK